MGVKGHPALPEASKGAAGGAGGGRWTLPVETDGPHERGRREEKVEGEVEGEVEEEAGMVRGSGERRGRRGGGGAVMDMEGEDCAGGRRVAWERGAEAEKGKTV